MKFDNERELVNAYLEKCKKTGYCEITEQNFSRREFFTEFVLPGIGRIDLISFHFGVNPSDGWLYGMVHIIEFKNGRLCRDDVVQINKYYQGIKLLIEDTLGVDIDHKDTSISIQNHLAGAGQDFRPDTLLLIDTLPYLNIVNHKIINGDLILQFDVLPDVNYSIDTGSKFYKSLSAAKRAWDVIRAEKEGR